MPRPDPSAILGTPGYTSIMGQEGEQLLNDPFRMARYQAESAPEAYRIASQMLAPGQAGGEFGPSNEFMFTGAAGRLEKMAEGAHPGMGDEEFRQAKESVIGRLRESKSAATGDGNNDAAQ